MDVQLYVYDLSQGLARQVFTLSMSSSIHAVYHTSIVVNGIEYFFGQGVQTCYPGTTHHGRPMEVVQLGKTELPMETILEFLDALKETYTAESYDLFLHNCNNFSHDFSMFLVGKEIPDRITSLPQTVLNTPFGQMLKPQLDNAMRSITQAPVPAQNVPPPSTTSTSQMDSNAPPAQPPSSHPHSKLKMSGLLAQNNLKPISYNKVPPLDKLIAKLGPAGYDPAVKDMVSFLRALNNRPHQEAPLPKLPDLSVWLLKAPKALAADNLFVAYDLLRLILRDQRASTYFTSKPDGIAALNALVAHASGLSSGPNATPDSAKVALVACQMVCNILSHPTSAKEVFSQAQSDTEHSKSSTSEPNTHLATQILGFATSTLLTSSNDSTIASNTRIVAANIAFNISLFNYRSRGRSRLLKGEDIVPESQQVELAASILEALANESEKEEPQKEVLEPIVRALGLLVYGIGKDGEVMELCRAMDAVPTVNKIE
ncbi:DUF862-domain-containing protein, partial [Aulographum hederae CBS 113979]